MYNTGIWIWSDAGLNLDATTPAWKDYYNMYSYITKKLTYLILVWETSTLNNLIVRCVLYIGLVPIWPSEDVHHRALHGRSWCPDCSSVHFSLSLCSYLQPYSCTLGWGGYCRWGIHSYSFLFLQVLTGYLGSVGAGREYDATELVKTYSVSRPHILIDQGAADGFLSNQLKPKNFPAACGDVGYPVQVRMQPHYDHSTTLSQPSWGTRWTITRGLWGSDPSSSILFTLYFTRIE